LSRGVFEKLLKYLHSKVSPGLGKNTILKNNFTQVTNEELSVGHINPIQPEKRQRPLAFLLLPE
jgi:hypothetical protein